MGILNNIWTFLITPNLEFINIILLFSTIIESLLFLLISSSILNISCSKKQGILYVLLSSSVGIISLIFIPNILNILVNYTIMIFLIFNFFKVSLLKSCLAIVYSFLIYALVGMLITNPYLTLLKISSEQLNSIPIYRIFYLLIMYSIIFVLSLIIKNRKFNLNFLEDMDLKNKYIILANFFLGFFTLAIQLIITIYYTDILPIFITFLSFILLLVYFSISIFSLTRIMKLTLTTRKLQSAEEYNRTLHILHDNVRGFKHDFDNIVTTIGGYIRTSDMEGLKSYYLQLEDDCQRVNNLYLLNPEIINNPRYLQSTY